MVLTGFRIDPPPANILPKAAFPKEKDSKAVYRLSRFGARRHSAPTGGGKIARRPDLIGASGI